MSEEINLDTETIDTVMDGLLKSAKPEHKTALEGNRNHLKALILDTVMASFSLMDAAMTRNATHAEVAKEVEEFITQKISPGMTMEAGLIAETCKLLTVLYIRAFVKHKQSLMSAGNEGEGGEDPAVEFAEATSVLTRKLRSLKDMPATMAEVTAAREQIEQAISGVAFSQCVRLSEQYFVFETVKAKDFLVGVSEIIEKTLEETLPSLSPDGRVFAMVLFVSGFGGCVRDYLEDITSDKMIFNQFIRSKLPHAGFNIAAATLKANTGSATVASESATAETAQA